MKELIKLLSSFYFRCGLYLVDDMSNQPVAVIGTNNADMPKDLGIVNYSVWEMNFMEGNQKE